MDESDNKTYDRFVKEGRSKGFTDKQINFLWDWICELARTAALAGGMF